MKKVIGLTLALLFVCTAGSAAFGQKSRPYSESDAEVYDGRVQQVTGKVVYLERDNKTVPAGGQELTFRRDGCKDCIWITRTDSEGNYKVFLGVGKYKLIVQWKNCGYAPTEDCEGHNYLSTKQPEYLIVGRGPIAPTFDIELVPNR
jgi:hypothetical protein